MSVRFFNLLAITSLCAVSAQVYAAATPLSVYNLILSGDFNVSGDSGHIEGKAFIGGSVINGSIYAQKLDPKSSEINTKVVGNFTGNSITHIESGYLAYGGTTNVTNSDSWKGICNGTGVSGSARNNCFKKITDGSLQSEKASILAQLTRESDYYESLSSSPGASIRGDQYNKTFKYLGAATELAVFNIAAKDITNVNWNAEFGKAKKMLINVSGSEFNAGYAHVDGFKDKENNVLWNFTDANKLNFGESWYGSILALNANIYTNSNLNGAIAAKSYLGNAEIHNYRWDYTPNDLAPVPLPASVWLFGSCLLGLIGWYNRPKATGSRQKEGRLAAC